MEELAKAVQKKYVEDITKKYPLHHFFILFIVLISSYIYSSHDDARILSEIKNIKINFIFDFKNGLLASLNFEQFVIAVATTWFTSYLYSKISIKSFCLLTKLSSFDSYISEIETNVNAIKSGQELLNYFIAKDISKELEGLRVRLKSFHTNSEIFLVLSICIGWGLNKNSYSDWLIVALFTIMIIKNLWDAFRFYISDFLPYYITEQTLLGTKVKFGDK